MRQIISISILIIIQSTYLFAQDKVLVSGVVKDSATNETLIGATVYITPVNKGLVTNEKGKFNISLSKSSYSFQISFLGYKPITKTISINSDQSIVFHLSELSISVDDIVVSATKDDDNIKNNRAGIIKLDSKDISLLPTLMGEPDIINAIRLTPGVQGGGEGNPGLYVRGGDAGQNLFLLDNMPLYNPSHLLGFFPVFNSDIIESVKVFKGGMPAQYGGKTSSVIDLSMKEGNQNNFTASGSIGLLSADLTLESPINNNKGTIIISGRRTYLNVVEALSSPFIKSSENFFNNTNYYFYDGSIKFRYNLGTKTKIFLTAFGSQDVYDMKDEEFNISNAMKWANLSGAIRLNHTFSDRLFMNLTSSKTLYEFDINAKFDKYNFNLYSAIDDWNNSLDFTWLRKKNNPIKFGVVYTKHIITPNKVDVDVENINYKNTNQYFSNEFATYINGEFKISNSFSITAGLRQTLFQHIGPYTHYIKNEKGQLSDSTVYSKNELVKKFLTLDPNLSWIYILNKTSSLKGSISMTHQFIHLASVGSVSLPTDIWLPSAQFIDPQRVSQISTGYFRNFSDNMFETSVEVYYKYLENQIDFKNGILDNFDNKKIEDNILIGTGNAFGVEFFIKKQLGKTTGWISYTLSKTYRQFDEINNGEIFPAKYDRTHDLSVTLTHKLNKKWTLSAVFIYATGNAMTLPTGRYLIQGMVANDYSGVNSFRMPAYHRLDVSANYQFKKRGRFESWINFSIYNVYNRANPYYIYFQVEGDLDNYYLSVKPKKISLFPILPSITWSFKF